MQSFSDANLCCCECEGKFPSASALLQHYARHALEREKQGNGEGNSLLGERSSRYDWQPWRFDDILRTKRKGHNFLESALLSINETCRKRAKLQTATLVSTSSDNSSHSLTEKATPLSTCSENSSERSDTSEAEIKGAEHSQDNIVQETQCLSNNFERIGRTYSKYSPKTSKATNIVKENSNNNFESSRSKNSSKYTTNDINNSKITSIIQEGQRLEHNSKCKKPSKSTTKDERQKTNNLREKESINLNPSKLTTDKTNEINIVIDNQKFKDDIEVSNKISVEYIGNSQRGIDIVQENQSPPNKSECASSKKLSKRITESYTLQENLSLKNNVESSRSKNSSKLSSNNVEEIRIVEDQQNVLNGFESNAEKCSEKPSKYTASKGRKRKKFDEDSITNSVEGCGPEIIKIEGTTSVNDDNNECIVGPEHIPPKLSNNLELPLELRTSETCFNRGNDACDVVYDNDDNNFNLDDSLGKANCDNNNIIIYYNDNSQDKLPKKLTEGGRNLEECGVVTECGSIEETKKKPSNRKQTTPKKIERVGFLKIAPRPDDLPRDDRVVPSKKGSKKKYCCPMCSRVFGWSTDLKRHILVHTGERPFKCTSCPSSFTRKFLLQKHQNKMHPLNGKSERERLLELKVSENLQQLKTKMLELQKSKENPSSKSVETENSEQNEEIDIKLEPPYETYFKIENNSDENWDSTSNNNNNNDGEMEFSKVCKKENVVFVEPIVIQSS